MGRFKPAATPFFFKPNSLRYTKFTPAATPSWSSDHDAPKKKKKKKKKKKD